MAQDIMTRARDVIQSGQLDTIQLAKKRYAQLLDPLCNTWGLTKTEVDILLFLANNPGLDRAADIVRIRQITKSHVSLSVSNLEQRGFVYRTFDPEDRRTAHLKLTEEALPVVREGNRIQQEFFSRIFAGLSEEEFALWRSILDRVCRNIQSM